MIQIALFEDAWTTAEHFKHKTIKLGDIADMFSLGTTSSRHLDHYEDKYPFVTIICFLEEELH